MIFRGRLQQAITVCILLSLRSRRKEREEEHWIAAIVHARRIRGIDHDAAATGRCKLPAKRARGGALDWSLNGLNNGSRHEASMASMA